MSTLILPPRPPVFDDGSGRWTVYQDIDEVISYSVDWSDYLGADTISASTWEADSGDAVVDSSSNTTTTTTVVVSKTDGVLKNTITTAASRTYVRRLEVVGLEK